MKYLMTWEIGDEMSNDSGRAHVSRMKAKANDEWISAYAIAEYQFCPRAGLIAFENKRDPDEEPPAYDILPRFEIDKIEEEISLRTRALFSRLWLLMGAAAIGPLSLHFNQYWAFVLSVVVMVFATWQAISIFLTLLELEKRKRILLKSRCMEPAPDLSEDMQEVDWFGMLNLGYESQTLQGPLQDKEWRFQGKPWRLLVRDDLIIPVFKTRTAQESPKDPHVTKCMAYCRLVSYVYERECPYGIVLLNNDYTGYAIPNCARYRTQFHNSLERLRHLIQASGYGSNVEVDYDSQKCIRCHLGRPHHVSEGQRVVRYGARVEPNTDYEGKHSDCGDRFEWQPPYRG